MAFTHNHRLGTRLMTMCIKIKLYPSRAAEHVANTFVDIVGAAWVPKPGRMMLLVIFRLMVQYT